MSQFLDPVLEPLRKRAYGYFVRKKLGQFSAPRRTISYPDARSIGVLFDASRPDDVILVDRFVERLSKDGKKVSALGFFPQKAEAVRHFDWFDRQGISWWGQPTDKTAQRFQDNPFDILVNAWLESSRPLEYLSTFSKARWRIAPHHEDCPQIAEFSVMMREGKSDLETYLSQVDHFLRTIRGIPHQPKPNEQSIRTVTA